ncbi:MAG: DNA cytosine methyltransferase [Bacteroidales bacterium]|nr:DNA cytosine methyltransferase [Bacteroidales bacterium]
MRKIKHASLFSGIGGPEVAAAMLGWDNVFHCEINPFGRRVLDYWFPNSESYEDITKTEFTKWRGRVDVLTGGFPCQPFSYAGKRGGAEDDRYLWPQMLRVIGEVRPAWVVGENVAGITTMVEQGGAVVEMESQASLFGEGDGVHRYKYRQPFTIERVCSDLEGLGYSVQPVLIPACAVGAPHRRDRVFIIANADQCNDGRNAGENEGEGGAKRIQERNEIWQSGEPDQVRPEIRGLVADTGDIISGQRVEQREIRQPQQKEFRRGGGEDGGYITVGTRWRGFPSVSPVHRGDDGIPFNVDGLSIPFGRWRNESLKAYGNAIVPQVMYEIFRAIEITYCK